MVKLYVFRQTWISSHMFVSRFFLLKMGDKFLSCNKHPGDSSRDLFIPKPWRSQKKLFHNTNKQPQFFKSSSQEILIPQPLTLIPQHLILFLPSHKERKAASITGLNFSKLMFLVILLREVGSWNPIRKQRFCLTSQLVGLGFFPSIVSDFHRIHGTIVNFTDRWMVDFDGQLVGKYTSPMDPMGLDQCFLTEVAKKSTQDNVVGSWPMVMNGVKTTSTYLK